MGVTAVIVVALTIVLSFGVLAYVHSEVRLPAAAAIDVAALADLFPPHAATHTRPRRAFIPVHRLAPLLPLPVNGPPTPETFVSDEITRLTESDMTSGVSPIEGDASSIWGESITCVDCPLGQLADSYVPERYYPPWPGGGFGGARRGNSSAAATPPSSGASAQEPASLAKGSPFSSPGGGGGSDHDGPPNNQPDPPTHHDPPSGPPSNPPSDPPSDPPAGPPSDPPSGPPLQPPSNPPTDGPPHNPDGPVNVPEPATIVLMGLGVGSMTLSRARATRR